MRLSSKLRGLSFAAALVVAACSGKSDKAAATSASAGDAEALCEHGVERDLCPKCNPELVAVYQGADNWCSEHGMPESFCPICHPDAHGRPPENVKPKAFEPKTAPSKAPRDGLAVKLQSEEVVKATGLRTVEAVRAPPKTALRFPARAVYDATRTADLTASGGGVVRSVAVDIGARVKAGDTLATLDSANVGGDRSRLAAAYRKVKTTQDRLTRVNKLEAEGVLSKREREDAELAAEDAKADAAALSAELGMTGATAGPGGSYLVKSPIDGVVTRRTASVGKLVDEKEPLFQIVDPTALWAELELPESRARLVEQGSEVVLTFTALPGEAFGGKVTAVLPEVDPHTRTVTARVAVKNPNLTLRANMFGEGAVLGDSPIAGVVIPRLALQTVDRQLFVFVKQSVVDYRVRHVTVSFKDNETAIVAEGLKPGEEVVTTGGFLLKTETLKDSIGAGCCGND